MTADTIEREPITLKEACELYPRSKLTVSTLRAEASRGRLDIFRLGKRDYTTAAAMQEMVRKCQDAARRPACTSIPAEDNGLSETDRASSAQAALSQTVAALKSGSVVTLDKNTRQSAARRR